MIPTINTQAAVLMLVCGSAWGFVRLLTDITVTAIRIACGFWRRFGPRPEVATWTFDIRAPSADRPEWLDGTPETPVGTPEWCALATDKIEGLTADLRSAVQVAWKRGAKDWARLNYPQWVDWLEVCDGIDGIKSPPPSGITKREQTQ